MSLQDKAVRQIRDSAVYVDLAIGESHSCLGKPDTVDILVVR
jgi:hypothetical protein